jgi:DHA1 family bicyclomycin/chloramphenicol resistance-like MFS transporter
MPSWSGVFGVDQASVQLTFSSYIVSYGLAQVVYGPLSDRYGRRQLMLFGLAVAVVGSVAAALASSLVTLTMARFVQGVGAAAGMVLGRAMVQDYFSGSDRARVMAYIGMAMGICAPLATVIGGQLHVRIGWRANFFLISTLAIILFITTWRTLPRDQRENVGQTHWLREMLNAYAHLARVPEFLAYVGILALSTGSFYIYLAGAPSVLANYGVGPASVGFFIMVLPLSYIVGSFLTSRLIKHTSESRLMLVGQCLGIAGVSLVFLLALAQVQSPFAVAAPLILLGIGQGLLMPSTLAGTVSVVPALAGAAVGIAGLAQQLAGAVGGYVIGIFAHNGALMMGALMSMFMIGALGSQLILRHLQRRAK